jgi:hypothetical protein
LSRAIVAHADAKQAGLGDAPVVAEGGAEWMNGRFLHGEDSLSLDAQGRRDHRVLISTLNPVASGSSRQEGCHPRYKRKQSSQ